MIRLTQTSIKINHASTIRPIKNKLFTDEMLGYNRDCYLLDKMGSLKIHRNKPTHRVKHIPQTALSRHANQSLREELAPFPPRQKLQFFSPSLLFFLNRNHTADTDKATSKDSETLDRPYLHATDDRTPAGNMRSYVKQ
jgi:hypothetical protein